MADQYTVDSLRGELREEKEVVEALEESKRDAERILSDKIAAPSTCQSQRDQLDQQVRELLEGVDSVLAHRLPTASGHFYLRDNDQTRELLQQLLAAADQVRKERGDA